ncbi:MAG: hypothetical protein ACI37Z_03565 [Candidatus Gastranaerophilaceae bacterium]
MKITIRKGVFETNSSSTHAIAIARNKVENYPESLTFKLGDFAWDEEHYILPTEKASYLYTALATYYLYTDDTGKEKFMEAIENINKVLAKKGINCTFEHLDELYKESYEVLWKYDATIDHVDELADFIEDVLRTESRLLRYLFSFDSFILTGNDNDDSYVGEKKVQKYLKEDKKYEVYFKGN